MYYTMCQLYNLVSVNIYTIYAVITRLHTLACMFVYIIEISDIRHWDEIYM